MTRREEAEQAMRLGPAYADEEARARMLRLAINEALSEAACHFERMVAEGDTEPLNPGAVARMIRERIRKEET